MQAGGPGGQNRGEQQGRTKHPKGGRKQADKKLHSSSKKRPAKVSEPNPRREKKKRQRGKVKD